MKKKTEGYLKQILKILNSFKEQIEIYFEM